MDHDELGAWLRLTLTPGIGTGAARRLLARFGLPQAIFQQTEAALQLCVPAAQAKALREIPQGWEALWQTTAQWLKYFSNEGLTALPLEASKKQSVKQVVPAIKRAAADVLERARDRGFSKTIRCMVIGVPNVGKSTLINTLAGRAPLKTEDRPGVTRATQWVKIDPYLELMDTPGMLWPKLEDKKAARRLAYIAAIRDQVLDVYALCISLLNELMEIAPQAVCERYKVTDASLRGQELLEAICRGRGFLLPGAACDLDRAVTTVLNEFRDGRIARLSLETPPQNAHDK